MRCFLKVGEVTEVPSIRNQRSVVLFISLLLWVTLSHGQTYIYGRTNLTVGSGAFSAAVGDFNGDGIPDIVSVDQGDNTVSALLGNLYGGFSPRVTYPTGPAPTTVISGDFNNDGNLDLAVADANCVNVPDMNGVPALTCSPGTISILLGNGDGTFQPHLDYATGEEPSSLVTGDFNGDGNLDLATANAKDGTVSVLLGQGDGTFQPQAVYTIAGAQTLVVGDFNNDHKLDLVVAAHTVVTLLGKGDGTFQAPLADASPLLAYDVAAADFNLDGKLDLYVGGNVFLGKGDGTFVLTVNHAPPSGLASATAIDLNGDAKPDLVLAEGNGVSVLIGNGDGTFQTAVPYAVAYYPAVPYAEPPYPADVLVTDLNGDGKLDLLVAASGCATFSCSKTGTSNLSILLGFGDGTFVGGTNYSLTSIFPVFQVVAADFNGDGKVDIAGESGNVFPGTTPLGVYLGNGDGTLQTAIPLSLSQSAGDIAAADLNGDGKADLASVFYNCSDTQTNCVPGQVVVLIGNGDGTFQPEVVYAAGLEPGNLTIADLNGDAKPDLAVSNYLSHTVSVLLNNGNGTFQTHQDYPTGLYPASLIRGDFNGDGKPDLIIQTETGFSLLAGNGDGTFRPHVDTTIGNQLTSLTAGDFNADGKLDLAAGSSSMPQVFILLGHGDGTFQTPVSYPTGTNGYPSVADFNSDGKADLIIGAQYNGTSAILLGNGDGTFGPPIFTFLGPGYLATPDLNQDGVPDIVGPTGNVSGSTAEISVTLSTAFKAVAPASLGFGFQGIGTTSAPQTITLSNPSHVSFNIAHIAASGNFSQTNDCGASLAQGKNCAITVSFSPAAAGSDSGAITISDSTKISPLAIPLTGSGVNGPALTAHPGRAAFAALAVGTSSKPASVLLMNTGNSGLTITGISIGGADSSDFTQSNNCGAALAPAASCMANVTFSPTSGGTRVASLAISDTEPGSPQNIVLSGIGVAAPDFALGPSSPGGSQTISAGKNAQFSLPVTPVGSFTGMVTLTCSITPVAAPAPACSFSSSAVQLSGVAQTVMVTFSTAAPTTSSLPWGRAPVAWTAILLGALLPWKRKRLLASAITAITLLGVSGIGCGGGGSSSHSTTTAGTPAGTYTATIRAASGSLSHDTTVTVVVQ